ncbi:hypothetical protein AYL99_03766 [Fonsecaea erecta]|uniref:Fucose-specific lectin n=1 Tax=Fonsecaea erecta TaxID=1367422 RepID=A0A178ZQV9_9EURO|nr:hypothetical protein AYL99_03766 [Fonsecaea erecta]OAP61563.1 hypothetical protein AYL99_03766 [Fonsecaea erecta]
MSNPPANPGFQHVGPHQADFHTLGTADLDHYQPYASGPGQHAPSASPPLSDTQLASDRTSPTLGLHSLSSQSQSPATAGTYSEYVSPAPERADSPVEKERYLEPVAYYPPYSEGPSTIPPTESSLAHSDRASKDKPFYKRWLWIILALILVVAIAVAVPCGVVFGTKKHHSSPTPATSPTPPPPSNHTSSIVPTTPATTSSIPQPTGNPQYAIGPQLSPLYASKDGAFNGTGIAIAAANPGVDSSIFVFYQDFTGAIQFEKSDPADGEASWNPLYQVNQGAPRALNATPLATAAYVNDTVATWHLFYIDENYIMRQRILTNSSGYVPTWTSGPLDDLKLEVNHADTIGMQVCYWGNFYGDATDTYTDGLNGTDPAGAPQTGMHLWFADTNSSFRQFDWTNRSAQWTEVTDHAWDNLDGHAGVGCQTWESGTTEYVFFVNENHTINMWWKDNNFSASNIPTPEHPVGKWTLAPGVNITDVHPSSTLSYTNYLVYQGVDGTVQGSNILFAGPNGTAPEDTITSPTDYFVVDDSDTQQSISAISCTHLCNTAVQTESKGVLLIVLFQVFGDDIQQYNRDGSGGPWYVGPAAVIGNETAS